MAQVIGPGCKVVNVAVDIVGMSGKQYVVALVWGDNKGVVRGLALTNKALANRAGIAVLLFQFKRLLAALFEAQVLGIELLLF